MRLARDAAGTLMTPAQVPNDIAAYVDGEVSTTRRHEIEALARANLEVAAAIAALRTQNTQLKRSLDSVLDEAIPQHLLHTPLPRFSPAPRRFSWTTLAHGQIAAALAMFILGAGAGGWSSWQYFKHRGTALVASTEEVTDLPRFVHQAAVAYAAYTPDIRHPVELLARDQVALESWLSARLGRDIRAPNLANLGFSLVGGRLLPAEISKPAAQFMYEDAQGQRVTVYLRGMAQPTPETAFRYARKDEVATFYWVEHGWGYALSSDLPRADLLRVARTIYEQLSGAATVEMRHEN